MSRGRPDRIDVVTAVLCTAEEFPGELGDDYDSACAALGLAASSSGYALVLGQDRGGARWTQLTADTDGVASVLAVGASGVEFGYRPPEGSVLQVRPGWPIECSLGLTDRPAPHDPGTPAKPAGPSQRRWTPAERRRLADQIAEEIIDYGVDSDRDFAMFDLGETDLEPERLLMVDLLRVRGDLDQAPVRRAVEQAWKLAAAATPPPGSVRTVRAGSKTRMVRAAGDGWNLVARPHDGPAVLLLDELPGRVLDLTGADRLAELLDALVAAAYRTKPTSSRR